MLEQRLQNMNGRETMKGAPPTDLLVCFPSRAHLTLMPKPICSPGRVLSGTETRRHRRHRSHHLLPPRSHQPQLQQQQSNNQLVKKPSSKRVKPSPILWVKSKQMGSVISEPTSPKVTCAGQIKVKSKTSKKACKNWQSVMEEIERIHNKGQSKKRSGWAGSLGFHKDVVQFLTCLRNLKFKFGCFGSFPATEITTTDDEDEDDEDDNNKNDQYRFDNVDEDKNSKTLFSKWFMVLQEDNNSTGKRKAHRRGCSFDEACVCESPNTRVVVPAAPPPNALQLMRCRSAPAKSWSADGFRGRDERTIDDEKENERCEEKKVVEGESKKLGMLMDEEKRVEEEERENKKTENDLVLMRYDTEYYKISNEIAEETWVVDGVKDSLWRSRSWKS